MRRGGFTLVEVMIVIVIVGILATIAVPQLTRYIRKSRTVEAVTSLAKIAEGAKIYFFGNTAQFTVGTRKVLVNQVPAQVGAGGWAPAQTHVTACRGAGGAFAPSTATAFNVQPWIALKFSVSGYYRYRYRWLVAQQSTPTLTAIAYADALGDLDCNNVYGTWRMILRERRAGDLALDVSGPLMFSGSEID
jgi:prepilin-type N-terminal cleavage/methylation domain-containing protein